MWSISYKEALGHYLQIFERASKFGVQFKPMPDGRFPIKKGTESISSFPRPHNVSSLKRFLGMIGYFREYNRYMSQCSTHLPSLLRQKASFAQSDQHETESQDLKSSLLSKDITLYQPNWDGDFQVHTDASKAGCGAMLAQKHNSTLQPVHFASKAATPTVSRWPTAHQELLPSNGLLSNFAITS